MYIKCPKCYITILTYPAPKINLTGNERRPELESLELINKFNPAIIVHTHLTGACPKACSLLPTNINLAAAACFLFFSLSMPSPWSTHAHIQILRRLRFCVIHHHPSHQSPLLPSPCPRQPMVPRILFLNTSTNHPGSQTYDAKGPR